MKTLPLLIVCFLGSLISFLSIFIIVLVDISNGNHDNGLLLCYLVIFGWAFFYLGSQISKIKSD